MALCLTIVLLGVEIDAANGETFPTQPGYPISKKIQYGFTVRNKTNQLLKEAELWTYAPVKLTSTQKSVNIEPSHPYQLIADDLGNQVLHFRFEDLPPYAVRPVTIKVSLELSDIPNPIVIGDGRPFLRSEKYFESDDPEIRQFGRRFESATPRETAEKAFHWVANNIAYAGYLRDSRGALYAFRNKRGDCTEYMCLFTALCRANGIPARGMGGYFCGENCVLEPGAYHNWAEFYDEGGWRMADPQKNILVEKPSRYIAMRIVGESPKNPMGEINRFRVKGEGFEVRMTTSRDPEGAKR